MPPGDDDFSTRWRLIKTFFVRGLPRTEWRSCVRRADGERGIWQRRFWEHAIRDDGDYATHIDYVHFNPVKHGLVASPAAWPYSTFKSCARRGLYTLDWTGSGIQDVPAAESGGREHSSEYTCGYSDLRGLHDPLKEQFGNASPLPFRSANIISLERRPARPEA